MRSVLVLSAFMVLGSVGWSSPAAPDSIVPVSAQTPSQPEPVRRTTLVPVHDPRCGGPMPIFQDYREVPVEEAEQPPKCRAP